MSLSSSPASIEIRLPGVARLLLLIPVLLAILIGGFVCDGRLAPPFLK